MLNTKDEDEINWNGKHILMPLLEKLKGVIQVKKKKKSEYIYFIE